MPHACPTSTELQAYNLGALQQTRLDEISDHVESCPACESLLDTLDGEADVVVSALREARARDESTAGSSLWDKLSAATAPAPAETEPPPRTIGDYEILNELGRGGMGVVYQARHQRLRRTVALKLLLGGPFADEHARARFRAEAEMVARLQHPHIVQLFEIGEYHAADGPTRPFMALEFIEGESLSRRLSGKPQPSRQAALWLETLARATHHAHLQGIIHRDLKPANVLVNSEGMLKICDFGVAKSAAGSDIKTLSGVIVGTPEYMAPEQAVGAAQITAAADIYALGAILYTMLVGRPPFQGATTLETLTQVQLLEAVPPRRLQPEVPRDLETICLKCLQKEPRKRYASALELAADLRRFLDEEPIVARPTPTWERVWKWARRRPGWAALTALSLFVLGVGFPVVTALWYQAAKARDGEARQKKNATLAQATAENERTLAEAERDKAERAQAIAETERDKTERALYAGRIRLADRTLASNVAAAEAELDLCAPEAGRDDLRGWEWHYLKRLCKMQRHSFSHVPEQHWNWLHATAFHPDGKRLFAAGGMPGGTLAGYPDHHYRIIPGVFSLLDAEAGLWLRSDAPHAGSIFALALSPDGKRVATAGADGWVKLWDAETFKELPGPAQTLEVYGLSFSPDGRELAITSSDGLSIWSPDSGQSQRLQPRGGRFNRVAFSPDGRRLIGESDDAGIPRLWERRSGRWEAVPHQLPRNKWTAAAAFSPDGKYLALTHEFSPNIQVWDAAGRRLLYHLVGHDNAVLSVTFTPDGRLVSGSDDSTIRLWNVEEERESVAFRGHAGGVISLTVSANGRQLASGGKDQRLKVWDLTRDPRGLALKGSPVGGEYLGNLSFSSDGRRILVVGHGGEDFLLRSWDAGSGRRVLPEHRVRVRFESRVPHRDFVFSSDGSVLAAFDRGGPAVRVWNTQTGAETPAFRAADQVSRIFAVSGDGRSIAYFSFAVEPVVRMTIHIGQIADGATRELKRGGDDQAVCGLAFDESGRRLAVAWVEVAKAEVGYRFEPRGRIQVLDTQDGTTQLVLDEVPLASECKLAFDKNGDRLAVAAPGPFIEVWDLKTRRPCYPPLRVSTAVTGIAFSPDGRRLAATGMDSLVPLWDAETGKELLVLRGFGRPGTGHYGFAARVVFSPDGKRIAANDWQGGVNVWDIGEPTAEELAAGHVPLRLGALRREARMHAAAGRYAQAVALFDQAVELHSEEEATEWLERGYALLGAGNVEGYLALCRRMVERHGKDAHNAFWAAWLCAARPNGIDEPARLPELAHTRLKLVPNEAIARFGVALAHYRAGLFREAVQRCHESLAGKGHDNREMHSLNWVLLALAHKRLDEPAESAKWLIKVDDWLKREKAGLDDVSSTMFWPDLLLLKLLRAEADKQ